MRHRETDGGRPVIWLLLCASLLFSGCRDRDGWAEIFVRKGEEYYRQGHYENAVEEFLKAQQLNREDKRVHLALAKAYYKNGQWQPALEFFNMAVYENPGLGPEIYAMRDDAMNRRSRETASHAV